jgi:hypothetical protein
MHIKILSHAFYNENVNQSHYRPELPRVSRKLRFPDHVTMAQNGGKVMSLTHRPFYPQEIPLVLISVRG